MMIDDLQWAKPGIDVTKGVHEKSCWYDYFI